MSRINISDAIIDNALVRNGNRFGVSVRTLTADGTVAADGPQVLFIDPGGGARNLDLWASPQRGDWVLIFNTADAAEVITVRTSAGAGLTPAITPTQSEAAFIVYNGTAWVGFVAIGA